jgi:hypothetical protein
MTLRRYTARWSTPLSRSSPNGATHRCSCGPDHPRNRDAEFRILPPRLRGGRESPPGWKSAKEGPSDLRILTEAAVLTAAIRPPLVVWWPSRIVHGNQMDQVG